MGIQEHFTHNELNYILLYVCLGVRQLWGPPIWPRNFLVQFILSSSAPEDDSIDLWTHSVVYKRMCKGSFKSSITFPCVPNQRFVGFFFLLSNSVGPELMAADPCWGFCCHCPPAHMCSTEDTMLQEKRYLSRVNAFWRECIICWMLE